MTNAECWLTRSRQSRQKSNVREASRVVAGMRCAKTPTVKLRSSVFAHRTLGPDDARKTIAPSIVVAPAAPNTLSTLTNHRGMGSRSEALGDRHNAEGGGRGEDAEGEEFRCRVDCCYQ